MHKQMKYLEIADELEKVILRSSPGEKIISTTEQRKKYNASATTVNRAMIELQNRGLIYTKVGEGSFVAPRSKNQMIIIVTRLYESLNHNDMVALTFAGCARLACHRNHPDYNVIILDYSEFSRQVDDIQFIYPGAKGVIFVREPECFIQTRDILESKGIKSIFYGSSIYMNTIKDYDYLVYDELGIAKIAINKLRELKHSRVGILYGSEFPVYQARYEIFKQAAANQGIEIYPECEIDSEAEGIGNHAYPAFYKFIEDNDRVNAMLKKVTAVYSTNDLWPAMLMQKAMELGFKVPGDVAFLGVNNRSFCTILRPPLSSVDIPLQEDSMRSLELLVRKIDEGKPAKEFSNLSIKVRRSLSPET